MAVLASASSLRPIIPTMPTEGGDIPIMATLLPTMFEYSEQILNSKRGRGEMAALKTDRIAFSFPTCEAQPGNPPFHLLILHHEPKRDRGPRGHGAAQSQRGSVGGAASLWKGNHLGPRSSRTALCNSLELIQQMQGHSLEAWTLFVPLT